MYVIEKPLNNIILLCFLKGNLRVFYEREPREHVSLYLWKCALHGNQIVPRKSGHFLRKSDAVEFGGWTDRRKDLLIDECDANIWT